MKNTLYLFLTAICIVSFVACGGNTKKQKRFEGNVVGSESNSRRDYESTSKTEFGNVDDKYADFDYEYNEDDVVVVVVGNDSETEDNIAKDNKAKSDNTAKSDSKANNENKAKKKTDVSSDVKSPKVTEPTIYEETEEKVTSEESDDAIFMHVEKMPEFPGGTAALMQYLNTNIKYPVIAQENGIQGRCVCQFTVNKDGSIVDVKVVRSAGDASLDKEAVRVIQSMPKWKPGMQQGKVVRVKYTVPVSFKLQ